MSREYSSEVVRTLEREFSELALFRPMRISRYEPGTELVLEVKCLKDGRAAKINAVVGTFVGGGFAGQVYKLRIDRIEGGPVEGLSEGMSSAMKILVPPKAGSCFFRNMLYWAGFQGPFQLQVNPSAARAGAIWQKFIRRAAKIYFGDEKTVVNIYATFVDENIGSCGELSEWVEGRTWRLEVDDHLDLLRAWEKGTKINFRKLGSHEYRFKRKFMAEFVGLLHEMGAHEFARQYEWSTWKSQPNCLKRKESGDNPEGGLVAVDFRAGLALLPFLPMSPGDPKLILKGILRGSFVQFDRGNLKQLFAFVEKHRQEFCGMEPLLEELKAEEAIYRNSVADITHHHVKLFYSSNLWGTILDSAVTGWKVRNYLNDRTYKKLRESRCKTLVFMAVGIIPFLGSFLRKFWGREDWKRHYRRLFSSWNYLKKSFRGRVLEKIIGWHRSGRMDQEKTLKLSESLEGLFCHIPLSLLPVSCHRFLTDWRYSLDRMKFYFVRPILLYFNQALREQWLRDMLNEGKKQQLLSEEDASVIESQLQEPFIQKYLKSLAVHVCTLPVTQVVSVALAILFVITHPEMPRAQSWAIGLGIVAFFQVIPISPGSLVRGLYVLYLVIRERNFRDYHIAVFLGFFKYVGYLAFPIQMAHRYPTLARFMAANWATGAVHIVPVFGERGALLEHKIYCLFYNWPLTLRRRILQLNEQRKDILPRYWPLILSCLAGAALLSSFDVFHLKRLGLLPPISEVWVPMVVVPLLCGVVATFGTGGASTGRRVVVAALGGVGLGVLSMPSLIFFNVPALNMAIFGLWRFFLSSLLMSGIVLILETFRPVAVK